MEIRPSAFSGSWYPADAADCERQIRAFQDTVNPSQPPQGRSIGGIVPHAGWYFSGHIACQVIAALVGPDPPAAVVVMGMHLHPRSANCLMPSGAWQTPLGPLPVHTELAQALLDRFDFREETPGRFEPDNTIELQMPFVKYFFPDTHVLGIGLAPNDKARQIGGYVADWARTQKVDVRIIGSTDLTHYGANYGFSPQGSGPQAYQWVTQENDRRVIEAMLALDGDQVMHLAREDQNACCSGAAAGAIFAARQLGATRAREIAYASSYDKSPGESFVGYAGIVFEADPP